MADEGEFPKSDGDVFYASEANDFQNPIQQVYTGTGFDTSGDEQDHELDAVTATNDRNYAKVTITGSWHVEDHDGASPGQVELKAQIKEIGQSYVDIEPYTIILNPSLTGASADIIFNGASTIIFLATLTAGMKTNGFQIKVFSKSTTNGSGTASFTNIQTVQELA